MERLDMGSLPKQHKMEDLFPGKVVKRESSMRDKDVNEISQEKGARLGYGGPGEAAWCRMNIGYSERIKDEDLNSNYNKKSGSGRTCGSC